MKLRSVTEWTTRAGKVRRLRLFQSYRNMLNRTRGNTRAGNGSCPWKGITVGFLDWREFRAWSLANGYSKERCSLDRVRATEGYVPGNLQWITVAQNTAKMHVDKAQAEAPREPEYIDWSFLGGVFAGSGEWV